MDSLVFLPSRRLPHLLVTLGLATAGCGDSSSDSGPREIWYLNTHDPNVPQALLHETGVIRRRRIEDGTFSTCGATFIAPKFAVTSATCVGAAEGIPLEENTVEIQTFASTLSREAIEAQATVIGSWPDFMQLEPAGYDATIDELLTDCRVVRRCLDDDADPLAAEHCEAGFEEPRGIPLDANLGLVYCPSRVRTHHAEVAELRMSRLEPTPTLALVWFHEVVDAPKEESDGNPELFDHYTMFAPLVGRSDNYHFRKRHFVFPLLTGGSADESFLATLEGSSFDGTVSGVRSWAPACLGSSGSGMFLRPEDGDWSHARLAAVAWGPGFRLSETTTRLCQHPSPAAVVRNSGTAGEHLVEFLGSLDAFED